MTELYNKPTIDNFLDISSTIIIKYQDNILKATGTANYAEYF